MQYIHLLKKYRIPITAGIIVLLGISLYSLKNFQNEEEFILEKNDIHEAISLETDESTKESTKNPEIEENQESQDVIVVDVAGEVNEPSVYILPYGTRIYQAIEAAGGLGPKADTGTVNLAAVLQDGTKLYIPKKNENIPVVQTSNPSGSSGGTGTFDSSSSGGSSIININTADSAELQKLSGVGPATAEKILAYRREYGRFNKIEDLMNVSGIGAKTFAKLKSQLSVN